MHTQLIISFVSIAVAAAVALACDYMRARNAQLQDQLQGKVDRMAPKTAKHTRRETAGPRRETRRSDRIIATEAAPPPKQLSTQRLVESERQPAIEPAPKKNPALTTWLIERAVERAAQKTQAELPSAIAEQKVIEAPGSESRKPEATKPEAPASAVVDTHLWDFLGSVKQASPEHVSIEQSSETKPEGPRPGRLFELIQGSGPVSSAPNNPIQIEMKVPTGMHTPAVLSQIMESCQPFTGLVISIGVSAKDSRETRTEDLALSVEQFIAGLLRSSDFGCRVDQQEFLLLCPGPRGAEAQGHLSHVSERLWDYQLRALGKLPLVFTMGGTDIQGERVTDAIASAQQRMNQSRRSPISNAMSLVPQRRRAV